MWEAERKFSKLSNWKAKIEKFSSINHEKREWIKEESKLLIMSEKIRMEFQFQFLVFMMNSIPYNFPQWENFYADALNNFNNILPFEKNHKYFSEDEGAIKNTGNILQIRWSLNSSNFI